MTVQPVGLVQGLRPHDILHRKSQSTRKRSDSKHRTDTVPSTYRSCRDGILRPCIPGIRGLARSYQSNCADQVREVDVSSNPLKTEGLAQVFLGLVGKKELSRMYASECGLDLHRIDDGLTVKKLLSATAEDLAAVDSKIDDAGKTIEEAFLAMIKDVSSHNISIFGANWRPVT
jgi:hypothetical protein